MQEEFALLTLGKNDESIELHYAEEIIAHVCHLVSQATRIVRFYTPDLEHGIYDNSKMVDAFSNFARNNRNAELQILIEDINAVVQRDHLILDLSRRLPSSIKIRKASAPMGEKLTSFLLADTSGVLAQSDKSEQPRIINFNNRIKVAKLAISFDQVWHKSVSPAELRSLPL